MPIIETFMIAIALATFLVVKSARSNMERMFPQRFAPGYANPPYNYNAVPVGQPMPLNPPINY